jgi:hypothetical protein
MQAIAASDVFMKLFFLRMMSLLANEFTLLPKDFNA